MATYRTTCPACGNGDMEVEYSVCVGQNGGRFEPFIADAIEWEYVTCEDCGHELTDKELRDVEDDMTDTYSGDDSPNGGDGWDD
jgi:hypothetical protein